VWLHILLGLQWKTLCQDRNNKILKIKWMVSKTLIISRCKVRPWKLSISLFSFNLRLRLPSDLFHSGSLTNILYAFRICFLYPSHPPWFYFIFLPTISFFKCFRLHKRTMKCFIHHWTRHSHEDLDSECSLTCKMLALKSEQFVLIHVSLGDVLVTSVTVL